MGVNIVLIRHGRSPHQLRGLVNREQFLHWRETYEAAGIIDTPPPQTVALARDAGAIASSDAPRARESAALLVPGRDVVVTPLLRELELAPPMLRGRYPVLVWALAFGVRSIGGGHILDAERARAREAAAWLTDLAAHHETIVAVTHASFRALVAKTLRDAGWQGTTRGMRHWSAWTLALPTR